LSGASCIREYTVDGPTLDIDVIMLRAVVNSSSARSSID